MAIFNTEYRSYNVEIVDKTDPEHVIWNIGSDYLEAKKGYLIMVKLIPGTFSIDETTLQLVNVGKYKYVEFLADISMTYGLSNKAKTEERIRKGFYGNHAFEKLCKKALELYNKITKED